MLAWIGQAGHIVGTEQEQADVIIINTCGFIADACRESYEAISQALAQKQAGPCRTVIVAGCLSQRMGRELLKVFPGIDAMLGPNSSEAELLKATSGEGGILLGRQRKRPRRDTPRVRITPMAYAYLRISEGCSQHCSFCTIPAIRGSYRSKTARTIIYEAKELLANGAAELNIIGQDTSSYGRDYPDSSGLGGLLQRLDRLAGLGWLRVLYAYPSSLDNDTIKAMAQAKHVVHYLDMPLQHVSDRILRRMGRRFSRAKTERLIERLFKAVPDLALRTTMIVGFPGETDSEFQELLDFVAQVRFHALGAFVFSPEPGTPAGDFAEQLPEDTKQQRLEAIMRIQQQIVAKRNRSLIGQHIEVLVERVLSNGYAEGRYYGQAPEVDGICRIERIQPITVGRIIPAVICGYDGYDLLVKPDD
jgi:ribosomal protein S12 methylthiotransferase